MKPKVTNRLIMPIQSAGQIGKSTALSCIIEYLKIADIPHLALDADPEHKTLSGWHPEAGSMAFRAESDLLTIFEHLGNKPVELIDFPAQATSIILEAFNKYKATELLAEKGIAITVLIFANEDQAGLAGAFKIKQALGDNVEYLIIENPAKFGSAGFWSSKVGEMFKGCPIVRFDKLEDEIVSKVKDFSKSKGRTINFIEGCEGVEGFHGAGLETWKDNSFFQIHEARQVILPEGVEPKGKYEAEAITDKKEINVTDLF